MTKHKTGTRKEWLAARSTCSRRRRNSRGAATSWRGGGRNCRGSGSTRRIASRPTKGALPWRTSSEGARSSSSTTSCSGPTTRRAVRPARRSRTGSTGSRFGEPRRHALGGLAGAARDCRPTSGGWRAASLGVVVRRRLQLRLRRLVHEGAKSREPSSTTSAQWMSGPSSPMSRLVPSMARTRRRLRGKRRA